MLTLSLQQSEAAPWGREDARLSDASVPGICDGDHVDRWELGRKRFEGWSDGEPCVVLQFTIWDADDSADGLTGHIGSGTSHRPCYALDIRLEYPFKRSEDVNMSEPPNLSWAPVPVTHPDNAY